MKSVIKAQRRIGWYIIKKNQCSYAWLELFSGWFAGEGANNCNKTGN